MVSVEESIINQDLSVNINPDVFKILLSREATVPYLLLEDNKFNTTNDKYSENKKENVQ